MSYVVLIDRISQNGLPVGQPIMRNVRSEAEALAVMQDMARTAEEEQQQMLFSLYDHQKRLLISYTSRDRVLTPVGAFVP